MHTRSLRASLGVCAVLVGAVLSPRAAGAQATGTIRGHVAETGSRRPLGDVQITVNGTQLGAVTNQNGDYAIGNVPAGAVMLQARRLGYARRTAQTTVTSSTESRVDFELDVAATQLDAIVTTGTAGAVEKRTVSNAITQIDAAEVTAKTNVTNVTEILQARTPGVQINAGSGTPGTAPDITIRGASSFSVTRPVVYIDGVRMSTAGLGNFDPSGQGLSANSGGQTANALDLVNPEDIESIEVIKGPAASTLYGADAAGGVIQIITKKGSRGQQSVSWTGRVEAGRNDLGSIDLPTNYTLCDATKIAAPATWPGCIGVNPGTVLSMSPIKDDPNALRNGGLQQYLLSARGGGDRFSYYLSGSHDYEEGVLHNSYDKRNSLRANFGITASQKADFQLNFGIFNAHLRLPLGDESAQGILFSSQRGRPGRASTLAGQYFTASNGQPMEGWFTVTPYSSDLYDNETVSNRETVAATVNYQPLGWFRNRLTAGLDWTDGQATLFAPPNTPDLTGDNLGLTAQRLPRSRVYTLDYTGTAERAITSNLRSTTSIGAQIIATQGDTLSANGRGLGSPDVTLIGSTTTISAANTFTENNSVGYWIQEQLGWQNRLFLTAALRADDNSSFGSEFNAAYYPKAGLSWILSEEPRLRSFFNTIRANDFKLRAAFGEAGKAPRPYSATRTYTISTVTLGSTSGSALRTFDFGNPNLKPEKGIEAEAGFEANFLNDRIGADFTYYDKEMRDVLFSKTIAPSSGFRGVQQANLGRTKNTGIELGLTATPIRRTAFTWDSRVSLSTNKNKLVSFGDTSVKQVQPFASYGSVQLLRPGYPIAGYWGRFPQRNPDGTPIFVNGVLQLTDTTYIGPSLPTREIAFSNTFSIFRNFSIYSLFDYKGGHYNYRGAELYRCASAQNCRILNDPNTPATELPVYRIGAGTNTPFGLYVHKADFVKLRDVSVTYTLPSQWVARTRAASMSVTLAGHNLALWSDYPGPDPEVNTYGNRAFIRGDIYSMPMTRRLTAALNLTF